MNLIFPALLMLCGLGSAVFAATAARRSETFLGLGVAAAIAGARVGADALSDAGWIGCITASTAVFLLFRPDARWIGPVCGGALAGLLGSLLQIQGAAFGVAIFLAVAIPACSAWLAERQAGFAPDVLREEAMLFMLGAGLAVAVSPVLALGWQSALVLNREEGNASNQIVATWVLVFSAASVVLGGLYSALRRR